MALHTCTRPSCGVTVVAATGRSAKAVRQALTGASPELRTLFERQQKDLDRHKQIVKLGRERLLTEQERVRAEQERVRAEQERVRAEKAEAALFINERTAQLLRVMGMLHARGMMEFVERSEEDKRRLQSGRRLNRQQLWQQIADDDPALQKCICTRAGWPKANVGDRMASLYSALSSDIHHAVGDPLGTEVLIRQDKLAQDQCQALACICEAYRIPHRVVQEPTNWTRLLAAP